MEPAPQMRARPYVLLFLLLSVVYHSNLRPIPSGDTLPGSLIPFSILLDHSLTLDRFGPYMTEHISYGSDVLHKSGPHWYSVYPIVGPVLATPLYLPIELIPRISGQPPATLIAIARVAEKIAAVALAAAAAIALLFLLRRLTSERAAWMLTLLFALGTGNWSTSSQALWQHTFGQLAIIGCLYAIERFGAAGAEARWYWMAGTFAACALAIRGTNLVLLPVLALVLWLKPARPMDYLRVFAPAALAIALTAAYNFAVFQSFAGGYPINPLKGGAVDGLLGILLSPARGLLIYTPIAIFALAAFLPRARESRTSHRLVVVAASAFSLLHIAFIAIWPLWWGGYCWGPRLLTEILAPLTVLIAIGLPAIASTPLKYAFATAAVYGCLIQALGVYCYPKGQWDNTPLSINEHPDRLWNWTDNPIRRTAHAGIAWEPYAIVAAAAKGGLPAAAQKLRDLGINPY
jgi:hypothetical protein